jgi:uncharacterized protein (DUF302 family)
MSLYRWILAATALSLGTAAAAADGLVAVRSPYTPQETSERLQGVLAQRNLTVFARIDHAAGAARIGKTLRPTEVVIFGNPQGGTPFMECAQTAGIDLPLKALVWQDAAGQTWIGYNDPAYLARRHEAAQCPVVAGLSKALGGIVDATVAR